MPMPRVMVARMPSRMASTCVFCVAAATARWMAWSAAWASSDDRARL